MSEDTGNTVADLLSDEIAESGQHASDKYYISDISIGKNEVANVVCQTIATVDVIIAVYEESSGRMTASGTYRVDPDDISVEVELKGDIPEFYIIKGYLADPVSHSPVCEAYTCELYTQEMQQIMGATIDDYDSDRVINFDDYDDNNYAVFNDNVVYVQENDWQNVVSMTTENKYMIASASDEVLGLVQGQILAIQRIDGSIIVVSVGDVAVSSGNVIIEDAGDLGTKDVFEVVKINTECDDSQMSVDTTDMDERILLSIIIQHHVI